MKSTDIIKACVGNNEVAALYKGSSLIFQNNRKRNTLSGKFSEAGEYSLYINERYYPIQLNDDLTFEYNLPKLLSTELFGIYNNQKLVSLDVSDVDTGEMNSMSYMFANAYNIEALDVSDFDTSNVKDMSKMFYENKSLKSLNLGDKFDTSRVENMNSMFAYCSSLETLNLGDKFDTSNVSDMKYMFANCKSLKQLDVSGFDTSNVTDMSRMFSGCWWCKFDVSGFDTSNVIDMSYMFYSSWMNDDPDLSGFDTSNVIDMSYMFYDNRNAKKINVSGFDTSNVTNMSYMFSGCTNLVTLSLFGSSNVTNMSYMFGGISMGCSSLINLDMSNFNTSNVTDMKMLFYSAKKLESLSLGDNFNMNKITKDDNIFGACNALTNVTGTISNIKVDLSLSSSPLTNASAMVFINGLANVTSTKTITFKSTTYDTLTEEQIALATSKGWSVASA